MTGPVSRRRFLQTSCLLGTHLLGGCNSGALFPGSGVDNLGPLLPADGNGVRLPSGFTSRIIARSGAMPFPGAAYAWHSAPDGGAIFPAAGGGWIYVSNSEIDGGGGGVGALRFDAAAQVTDSYSILSGTRRNCAGGATPWGTWLSCEEVDDGLVYECDPNGVAAPVVHPALGRFRHEAAAVDPVRGHVYLSEDVTDGGFYRFVPDAYPDLSSGSLQIAEVLGGGAQGPVYWYDVPDPAGTPVATRNQVPQSTAFRGGEGLDYHDGLVYLATKGDDNVWCYDTVAETMEVRYAGDGILTGVDNLFVSDARDIFVSEDGGDLQIVAITAIGRIVPVIQLVGHDGSEVTGPALDASGTRLYFSSQRGTTGSSADGITFEVSGPFVV